MANAGRALIPVAIPRARRRGTGARAPLRAAFERLRVRALDEILHSLARRVVMDLPWGRLHEVGRRRDDRAGEAAVERELATADRVDDHARAVGRDRKSTRLNSSHV